MDRRSLLKAGAAGSVAAASAAASAVAFAGPAAAAGGTASTVPLSSFAGATDDDKLSAFMSYAAAQTVRGTTVCLDEPRTYTFAAKQTLYDGFSIAGTNRPQDQARSSMPVGNRVKLSTPGGWFALGKAQTFGCSFQNLSLDGGSGQRLIDGHASNVLWTSVFRDISSQNMANVLGSKAVKLLNTACAIDGWWNINNVRERAFVLGGSDTYFNPSMMLLDSGPTLLGPTEYLSEFSYQSNALQVSNIYTTAEGHSGWLFNGPNCVVFSHNVVEGRNASQPCNGALVRVQGGAMSIRDSRFAYAMANPTATGRNDAGVIHFTGGNHSVDNVFYDRGNTPASTPFIYVAAGKVFVSKVLTADGSIPIVKKATGATVIADASVQVV
jgi:hypothetical protein